MISSLVWVPKGAPRQYPVRFEVSQEELLRIKATAKDKKNKEVDSKQVEDEDELPKELRMDEYDDDDYEDMGSDEENDIIDDNEEFEMMEQGPLALAIEQGDLEQDDEDAEDDEVKASDSMVVTAITEDDFSHLEVQLYTEDGNLFVHHDINLPDFPLCLSWMDIPPFLDRNESQTMMGNFVAVGTFDPVIEIWNLDVLDPLEPTASLGGYKNKTSADMANMLSEGKKKSKKNKIEYKNGSHTAAVMSLSWNKLYRQTLASGSADNSVKIWDVTTQICSHTFTHHSDKVQAVLWHPSNGWLLSTGSFDKSVCMVDCRCAASEQQSGVVSYKLADEVEGFVWNPFNDNQLYCSLESGHIIVLDRRNASVVSSSFVAHDTSVTGIAFSAKIPGMLATASIDKTVRVWDVNNVSAEDQSPHMVAYKSMGVGKLFSLGFSPDDPFVLAAGGDTGMLAIWESDELAPVSAYFQDRLSESLKTEILENNRNITNSAEMTAATATSTDLAPLTSTKPKKDKSKEKNSKNKQNKTIATDAASMEIDDSMASVLMSVSAAAAAVEDDSWMDNTDTTTTTSSNKDKKKNNKKKDKKNSL